MEETDRVEEMENVSEKKKKQIKEPVGSSSRRPRAEHGNRQTRKKRKNKSLGLFLLQEKVELVEVEFKIANELNF